MYSCTMPLGRGEETSVKKEKSMLVVPGLMICSSTEKNTFFFFFFRIHIEDKWIKNGK